LGWPGVTLAVGWIFRRGDRAAPEDARRVASWASGAGDLEGAIPWLRRAREENPGDVEVALDLAWHLAALGRVEEALQTIGEVAGLLPPGVASWRMATTLFERDGEVGRIEALVVDALLASPALVAELRLEPALGARLAGRPAFERALAEALRRL
jgi:tetratricopeptide (TPR) repeat protein